MANTHKLKTRTSERIPLSSQKAAVRIRTFLRKAEEELRLGERTQRQRCSRPFNLK
jgi:hypothetical protein